MKPTGGHVEQLEKNKPRNKCRRWQLVANFGCVDGKYPRKTKLSIGTVKEANAALSEWLDDLELEAEREKTPTFSEYASAWHERRKKSGMYASRTIDREPYRLASASTHLKHMRMADITTKDIEDCYTALMGGDSPSGKCLKPWSISSIHTTLSKLFKDAVKDGVIESDPTREAKRPKIAEIERRIPTTQHVDEMVKELDPKDPRHMAILLCACMGLRRSEAVILNWTDWDGARMHITKAAEDDGTPRPTKNVKIREVPAPEFLRIVLDNMKSRGQICPMKPAVLSRWWQRNRGKWDMDGVRLHDLRHAYATRLAEAGVHPRVMMELGGWETIDVCMEIYTHVHSSSLDDAVAAAFS